jgi:glycosyltransferase involved in cell wall biosynthesis
VSQLCRLFKLKYLPILHGGNLEKRLNKNPKLSGLVFNNAYKLIAPSKFLKSVFFNYGYNDVLHIPNTIKIDNYEFLNRKIDIIKLLWVRSFSSIYNPSLALEVLKSLIEKNYKAELVMVGPDVDGTYKRVKNLAEQFSLKVNFTGKLSKSKWIELSKDYNVFINTTNYDNTPVSLIEAMALGLPIVSTDVGGLPYLISNREDALLVPPNNVNTMVDAIIELVDNDMMREKLINNSRAKAETFDWNVVKSKWEALLS